MKKTKLTVEEIRHIAKLANLALSDSELKKFQSQLSQVLEYVGKLSKVETKGVEPTSQVTGLENVFREDKVILSLSQKEILSQVKSSEKGFFKTKAIF